MSAELQDVGVPTIEVRLRLHPRRALDLLREDRRLRRAAKRMPRPLPWEWAAHRLMPLLAGPYLGPSPIVTVVGKPGCAVIFGVEIEGAYILVDRPVAERWEVSDSQLDAAAHANLARRAAKVSSSAITHGTLAGRIVRILDRVPWASSLVLAPEHLMRIFGSHDQVLGTARRGTLMSFPLDTPTRVIAHIVVNAEADSASPLMLDPFFLEAREIRWQNLDEPERRWVADRLTS